MTEKDCQRPSTTIWIPGFRDILVRAKLHSGGGAVVIQGDVLRVVSLDVRFVLLCVIVRRLDPIAPIRNIK